MYGLDRQVRAFDHGDEGLLLIFEEIIRIQPSRQD